jgi:hypothetical protein
MIIELQSHLLRNLKWFRDSLSKLSHMFVQYLLCVKPVLVSFTIWSRNSTESATFIGSQLMDLSRVLCVFSLPRNTKLFVKKCIYVARLVFVNERLYTNTNINFSGKNIAKSSWERNFHAFVNATTNELFDLKAYLLPGLWWSSTILYRANKMDGLEK